MADYLADLRSGYESVKRACRASWSSESTSAAIQSLARLSLVFLQGGCSVVTLTSRVAGKTYQGFRRQDAANVVSRPVNTHGQHFGIGNFRVLTITTSPERIASMIDALKQATRGTGSNQFLFVDRAALQRCTDALKLEWISGKGERVRLAL